MVTEVTAFASFFVGQLVLTAHGGRTLPADSTILTQVRSSVIPVVEHHRRAVPSGPSSCAAST